jgi:hypothetical protein
VAKLFGPKTRADLFVYYINKEDLFAINGRNKTQQAADLYLLAKKFGINGAVPLISDLLDTNKNTFHKRLKAARDKGFIKKIGKPGGKNY